MRTQNERLHDIEEFAFQLDENVGELSGNIATLNDIQKTFSELRVKMDNSKGTELQISELRRSVRLLSDLMMYLTNDLTENYEKVQSLNVELFQVAVKESTKKEQEKTPVTAMTEV